MCIGFILFYVYSFRMNTFFISKTLQFSFFHQMKDLFPMLFNSIIMGALVWTITLIPLNDVIIFALCIAVGVASYYVLSCILTNEVLKDTISLLKRKS